MIIITAAATLKSQIRMCHRQSLHGIVRPLRFRPSAGTTTRALHLSRNDDDASFFDVLIVGGGVIGSAMARQLTLTSQQQQPLRVAVVEAGPDPLSAPPQKEESTMSTTENDKHSSIPHPRSYAVALDALETLGISATDSSAIAMLGGGPYDSMQVWHAGHPGTLLWTTHDLEAPDQSPPPFLGCCFEDRALQRYLWNELCRDADVHLFPNTKLKHLQFPSGDGWVQAETISTTGATDTTSPASTKVLHAQLVLAADGANSFVRRTAGIDLYRTEYGQTAVTCTVELASPLQQRAFQRFGVGGEPLALLPTRSPHHAVIVWSTTPAQATWACQDTTTRVVEHWNQLLQTGPEAAPPLFSSFPLQSLVDTVQYGGALYDKAMDQFRLPPLIQRVASPSLLSFPLSASVANTVGPSHNVILLGDAAGTVHPLAGQGLNIGLRQVRAMGDAIAHVRQAGLPLNAARADPQHAQRAGIHVLQRLLNNSGNDVLWQNLQCSGMHLVQNVGPVRRAAVRAACYGL